MFFTSYRSHSRSTTLSLLHGANTSCEICGTTGLIGASTIICLDHSAAAGCTAIDYASNALSRLIVVLRVDALHIVDIFDELLVLFLACLDGEVCDVIADRLHVGLHKAIYLDEGEECVDGDAAHVQE